MRTITLYHCFMLFVFTALPLHAQSLSGTITDAETHQPLETAMIGLMRNHDMVGYALTDAKGHYTLPWKQEGTFRLTVSLLGYRKEMRDVQNAGILNISLQPEAIALKEVVIRPGRVYNQKDTIRYNLSEFTSSKDVYIKDVLKKLPGVDVDENGLVRYKGKAIDHYLVEGMDLTGGRYNQINNNLNAKAVKTAEIMESYQSVKALKGKINSDEVALNLKLDPKARDQWIVNGTLGSGWSSNVPSLDTGNPAQKKTDDKWLWQATLSGLQLGKEQQSIYTYKTNNNGTDLGNEQSMMTNINAGRSPKLSGFLNPADISTPLDKARLLFNETHTLNGNRMYRWDEEHSLRLQAGYTHDRIRQQKQNTQLYYEPDDTVRIDESYHYRLMHDAVNIETEYEDNSTTHYIRDRFTLENEMTKGISQELQQTICSSRLTASNTFSYIKNGESGTWELHSDELYTNLPASLLLKDQKERSLQHCLSANNYVSYLKRYNGFTQQYKTGIQGEWNTVRIEIDNQLESPLFNASYLSAYFNPYFQLEHNKMLVSLSLPMQYQRYFSLRRSLSTINPAFYARYQPDYHWRLSIYGSIVHNTENITDIYPYSYQTDYHTWWNTNGEFPITTQQSYSLYGEYKNTIKEFFATAQLTYTRLQRNTIYEQNISDKTIVYTMRNISNHLDSWTLESTISKGIYDWHLKSSLTMQASQSNGKQLSGNTSSSAGNQGSITQSQLQIYHYKNLSATPKLIWSPANTFEAEYNATLKYATTKIGKVTRLNPLLNVVQHLIVTFTFGRMDIRLSGEHYRNDLSNGTHLNTLFTDASLKYRKGKWNIKATLNNLFNKKEYAYTIYSTTQSSTSQLNIRPHELMFEIGYQF